MKKENRLKRLLPIIDECQHDEENFNYLYRKIKEEYRKECASSPNSIFANQLRQTIEKEAQYYISARQNNQDQQCKNLYNQFVINFREDITMWELQLSQKA